MADYFDDDFFIAPAIERAPESQPCGCHPEQVCQCDDAGEDSRG